MLTTLRNPLLDAGISRGLDPATSLATFGVVGGIVQFLAAAGLVVQSAFLVLVRGRRSYRLMRRYTALYIGFVLVLASLTVLPGLGEWFFQNAMGASPELLPRVVGWLSTRSFSWEVPVNNLSLIHDTGTGQELRYCFEW